VATNAALFSPSVELPNIAPLSWQSVLCRSAVSTTAIVDGVCHKDLHRPGAKRLFLIEQ
jgi:hypothetical protein